MKLQILYYGQWYDIIDANRVCKREYKMAFKLNSVVPWGRNMNEYKLMFQLSEEDMSKKIAGFGDGPACFNCEMTERNGNVTSFDMIYQFSKSDIEKRIEEVRVEVMQQMRKNVDDYFDIGLSSHFLLMYTSLGYDFHIASMTEMLRVCKEIRIFPIVDLDANGTNLIENVIGYFQKNYRTEIVNTEYEFQKGDNKLLIIRK